MTVLTTTTEYWDVDGVPLNTYAYNISTLTGRTNTPSLRGADQEQAYRPGRVFRPKVADSRTLTLAMWVQGFDPTTQAQTANMPAQFMENLRKLQKLFFTPRRQFTLTKRWQDLSGLHTASAKGQVINSIQPSHTRGRATLVIDVFLADPFFYDTTPTVLNVPGGGSASTTNPGDDASPTNLLVTLNGPLTNPVLSNTTPNPDIVMAYNGTIASGSSVIVDVAASRAVAGSTMVNNLLGYTGSIWAMEVFPGVNNFSLSGGSGSAAISYRPAYL